MSERDDWADDAAALVVIGCALTLAALLGVLVGLLLRWGLGL